MFLVACASFARTFVQIFMCEYWLDGAYIRVLSGGPRIYVVNIPMPDNICAPYAIITRLRINRFTVCDMRVTVSVGRRRFRFELF